MSAVRVPTSRQGQTGMGQGGWASYAFVQAIGTPVTVALRSAIPLEVDLDVMQVADDRWQLVDPTKPDTVILEGATWDAHYAETEAVPLEQAKTARSSFPLAPEDHPAPHCISCGLEEFSLRAHAGPLGDGRWATPWSAPNWSLVNGEVDESLLWMGMDCSCGWYVSHSGPENRRGVTVQFAVDVHDTIKPETDYSLVAWHGDYEPGWDGRKRGASAALFTADGDCVAQSRSFWLAMQ